MNIPLLDVLRENRLAVHTWWHSWNHYGMFGLSSEHSTLYVMACEGYVPLDAKELYLQAMANYNPAEYRAAFDAMLAAEKAWADQEQAEEHHCICGTDNSDHCCC